MAIHRMRVGDVEIVSVPDGAADLGGWPLRDGEGTVDWSTYRDTSPDGFHGDDHHWRIHNGCYLVRHAGRTTLVDLGVGVGPYPRYRGMRGALLGSLAEAGVALEEIDEVFLTHSHPDHVGWAVDEVTGKPRFPRARYVLHRADWDEFTGREPVPPFFNRFVRPLQDAGVLNLLEGESVLSDAVTAIETPGHTPGHISLLIASAGERAVITGDVITSPASITEPERPFGSDLDVALGIRTRQSLLARIEAEGLRVVAGHLAEPGFGEVVRVDGQRWWRAL
jgi:glyoxylase-like metal-dependent hydrolase (beta-lactamase superfamily II)